MTTSEHARLQFSLMCLFLVVPIPACDVRSNSPLSDPGTAKVDDRLVGRWATKPQEGLGDGFFLVEKEVPPGFPTSVLKVTMNPGGNVFVFCTQLKGSMYLNVCLAEPTKNPDWEKVRSNEFLIYRYSIRDDVLVVECMDKKSVEAAVRDGKLAGSIERDRLLIPGWVSLTDTSDKVTDFVTSGNARFKELRSFVRVK